MSLKPASTRNARSRSSLHIRGLSVGALLALALSAPAAQADDFGSNGLYLGGGVALGFENFDTVNVNFDNGTGLDFWLGLRLAKVVALEGQIQWLPGMAPSAAPGIDTRPLVYTGNIKGYLPLGRFQPYGLFGLGGLTTTPDRPGLPTRTDFVTKYGAGVDLYITKNIAAVASWSYILTTGAVSGGDFNTLTFGAQVSF